MMTDSVLGRYEAAAIRQHLKEEGVLQALERKGFTQLEVRIESTGHVLPHVLLFGHKQGVRCLLLEACLGEAAVHPEFFRRRGHQIDRPTELAIVHWIREQDPTVTFAADRPCLPLQRHPGLGVLRHAFRVAVRMARELQKDGLVSVPKFFHDAVIFYRSRLFLFLDGHEQGRFEALVRDLGTLSLGDASLVIAAGSVQESGGGTLRWTPGYQIFPLSEPLTAYFHSARYAAEVAESCNQSRFTVEPGSATRARARFREVMRRLELQGAHFDAVPAG